MEKENIKAQEEPDEEMEPEEDEEIDEENEQESEPKMEESKVKEIVMNSKKLRGWKLVKYIAYTNNMTAKEAEEAFNAVFNAIEKALEEDRMVFTPLGKIEVAKLKAKKTKIAFTGKEVSLPERFTVKLRVNGVFKKHLNDIKTKKA